MNLHVACFVVFIALSKSALAAWTKNVDYFIANASISDVTAAVKAKTFTCEQLISAQLRRIKASSNSIGAFISYNETDAMAQAKAIDSDVRASKLTCVAVAVKDNIDVAGMPTTNGVALMKTVVPTTDSRMVALLKQQQAVILGKANMAELSNSGTDSNNPVGGQCKNPFDLTRSCMGSSGGSGAAVAAGLAMVALGTDTEGSVIGPANANGLVGLRPGSALTNSTYLEGVFPAFSRMDEVGFLVRNMDDLLTLQEIAYGKFTKEALAKADGMKGIFVRVAKNMYMDFNASQLGIEYKVDADMLKIHNEAISRMRSPGGANVTDVVYTEAEMLGKLQQVFGATVAKPVCSKSCLKSSLDNYYARFSTGPFNSSKALFDAGGNGKLPSGYYDNLNFTVGQELSDICNDTSATSCKTYIDARATMTTFLTDLIGSAHILLMPLGPKYVHAIANPPSLSDQITATLNPYTGWPSISLPIGYSTSKSERAPLGVPTGLVLVARPENTDKLLSFAYAYNKANPVFTLPKQFDPVVKSSAKLSSFTSLTIILSGLLIKYVN